MKPLLRCLFLSLAIFISRAQVPEFNKVSLFPIASTVLTNAIYADGKFIAVGDDAIAYSLDEGVSWFDGRNYPRMRYRAVIFGNGLYVAVGQGRLCATSTDGATWTAHDLADSLDL